MEGILTEKSSDRRGRIAAMLAGVGTLALALVLRSDPDSAGLGFVPAVSALLAFAVVAVLPGYSALRLAGRARGSWIDWLGPSFAVSMVLHCLWVVPGYLLRFSLGWTGVGIVAVAGLLLGFSFFHKITRAGSGEPFFCGDGAGGWRTAFGLFTLLAMAQAAFLSLRALAPEADLWFHAAGTTQMVKTGFLELADPFHNTSEPLPMYLMSSWQALLAVVCRFSGTEAVDAVRVVPVALVPIAVSAFAGLVKSFLERPRDRLLALGLFLLYYGCLSTSMEASFERSMWREFSGPRWVALFCVYPVTLSLGVRWLVDGGWLRALAAAAINGAAMFVHPQGGQYYGYVLLFLLAGALLWRRGQSLRRTALALLLAGAALAPFMACRVFLLKGLVGRSVAVRIVSAPGNSVPVGGQSAEEAADDDEYGSVPATSGFSPAAAVRFGRAATLLFSPFFFMGLAGLPLWWRSAAADERRRLLLLSMGPALVLPLLPAVHLLPVNIFPNLLYRSVWAAPVLIATAVCLVSAAGGTTRDGAKVSPWFGRLWLALFAAGLIFVHICRPYRFEYWWRNASLFAVLCLVGLFLAMLPLSRPPTARRWLWALPAMLVIAACGMIAFCPKRRPETTAQFVAVRGSPVIAHLRAAEPGGGYVLTDSVTGNMLTALTGARVLGAGKTAITNYTTEYRRLDAARLGLLKQELSDEEFLAGCRSAGVTLVLVPKKSQVELLDRMARLAPGAAPAGEDAWFALYRLTTVGSKTAGPLYGGEACP